MTNLVSLFVVLPLLLFVGLQVHGQNAKLKFEVANARLPTPRYDTSAVYDGDDSVYIVGGTTSGNQRVAQVLKYSLSTDKIQEFTTSTDISGGKAIMSASGEYVIYLGGYNERQGSMADVYLFSTATKEWKTAPVQLPGRTFDHAVAWDHASGAAYILGGFHGGYLGTIIRFDATNFTSKIVGTLPFLASDQAGVWADGQAYTFGSGSSDKAVVQFDPVTALSMSLSVQLPHSVYFGTAVYDEVNKLVYILSANHLMTFNPVNEEVQVLEMEEWPHMSAFNHAAGVYVPKLHRMYVFGGYGNSTTTTEPSDQILYINLPGARAVGQPARISPPIIASGSKPEAKYPSQIAVNVSTYVTLN